MGLTILRGRSRLLLDDFSGGIDLATNPASLASNRFPVGDNMTLRGSGLVQRTGFQSNVYINGATDTPSYVFWQGACGGFAFVQEGAKLCRYSIAGTWTTRTVIKTFTSSEKIACCMFGGRLIATHVADGTWRSDAGFTTMAVVAATVVGSAIAVWENKVWVSGANGLRVNWCAPGDATTWNLADDYVDIRAVDDAPVKAVGAGNGMDVIGRSGLLVFKDTSIYRIYDSTTGAYTVVSTDKGASAAEGVTSGPEGVYAANPWGIYRIRGDLVEDISFPILPRWDSGSYSIAETTVAWTSNGRHYFTDKSAPFVLPIYEWEPRTESWYLHTFLDNVGNARKILSATSESQFNTAIPRGYLLAGFSGLDSTYNVLTHFASPEKPVSPLATDQWNPSSGAVSYAYTGYFRTPWFGGGLDPVRCDRIVVHGYAGGTSDDTVAVNLYTDYRQADNPTALNAITFPNTGALTYDVESAAAVINHLGVARSFQLELSHAAVAGRSTGLPVGLQIASTQAPTFGVTAVEADLIPLRN